MTEGCIFDMNNSDSVWTKTYTPPPEQLQLYKSLVDKVIVIVATGNDMNKLDQYEHMLNNLKVKLLIVEFPNSSLVSLLEKKNPGRCFHLKVNLITRQTLVKDVLDIIQQTSLKENLKIDAVTTFWDDAVTLTARIQKELGLKGNSIKAIDTCHDKYLSRKTLKEMGTPGPDITILSSYDDVKTYGPNLKYPLVIKPVHGAASIGVQRIAHYKQLVDNYEAYKEEIRKTYAAEVRNNI